MPCALVKAAARQDDPRGRSCRGGHLNGFIPCREEFSDRAGISSAIQHGHHDGSLSAREALSEGVQAYAREELGLGVGDLDRLINIVVVSAASLGIVFMAIVPFMAAFGRG